jgi:DNA polymerase-1
MLLAALHRLPKALAGLDAKLILHVHDEVVLEVADRDVPAAKAALEEAMVAGFRALLPDQAADMPGLVEAHAGPTWFDAKG